MNIATTKVYSYIHRITQSDLLFMLSMYSLANTAYLKLGHGALMSNFYPECYHIVYGAQRPVRWSALETLHVPYRVMWYVCM